MADKTVRGRFVWHEVTTPDSAGAQAFYTKVLGWKTQPWEHDASYTMLVGPSGPLGGVVTQPSGSPRWTHVVGTTDIDATVRQATSLGARLKGEITTMPNGSKYADLTDPQGAPFGVYWSTMEPHQEGAPKRGEFSWHELATTDYKAAFDFYSSLFGWEKLAEHDMGAMGVYLIFGRSGMRLGGIMNKPPQMQGPPAWCGYVRVRDVHETVKKAKAARGTLISGPMEVPGGDWIAQFLDPYGALFAVHTVAADMKSAQPVSATAPTQAAPQEAPAAKPAAAKPSAAPAKKPAKKAAKKKAAAKKAAPKRKRAAAKAVKRPARKASKAARRGGAKKKATATTKRSGGKSSGGKTRTAKKPRKGK